LIKRILFATDFSKITERAEEYAIDIAKATGARVDILHAIEPVKGVKKGDKVFEKFFADLEKTAKAKAAKLIESFEEAGVECDVRVEIGKRSEVIIEQGAAGNYDLLILGSHVVHDGGKVYVGTTTHKVFFGADIPLMVVPYK
jgi:nucleotide-binding universal stress UspA family protein